MAGNAKMKWLVGPERALSIVWLRKTSNFWRRLQKFNYVIAGICVTNFKNAIIRLEIIRKLVDQTLNLVA